MRHPRRFLTALIATVALVAVGCGSDSDSGSEGSGSDGAASGPVTLRVGDQQKLQESALSASGQNTGLSYGLEFSNFSDGPNMNAAINAGEIDVGYMGDSPVLLATASGADVVVLAQLRYQPNSAFQIVARPGSGINTLADLKGKKVAYTKGTALQGYALEALDTVDLTQGDITHVDVPITAMSSTLQSGNADAAVLASFVLTNYLAQNPDATRLEAPPSAAVVLLATRKALADPAKREAIKDYVTRYVRASYWIRDNRAAWVQQYLVGFQHQDPVVAEKTFERQADAVYGPVDDDLVEHQKTQAELLTDVGVLPPGVDAADEFDDDINKEFNDAINEAVSP